jgi:hypothetical protein
VLGSFSDAPDSAPQTRVFTKPTSSTFLYPNDEYIFTIPLRSFRPTSLTSLSSIIKEAFLQALSLSLFLYFFPSTLPRL